MREFRSSEANHYVQLHKFLVIVVIVAGAVGDDDGDNIVGIHAASTTKTMRLMCWCMGVKCHHTVSVFLLQLMGVATVATVAITAITAIGDYGKKNWEIQSGSSTK